MVPFREEHVNRQSRRLTGRRKRVLARQPLHHQVADELRDMIVHGELVEGAKVPVADVARALGVSLTPLREALKVLAEENLVELLPNRGARVKVHTVEDASQLFEVIAELEALAAELATRKMSESELAELEDMHARMRGHYDRQERTEYFDLNSVIHRRIIELAANEVLSATHAKLSVRANRGRFLAIADPARWAEAMDEHEQLMDAFRRRDAAAAMAVWRVHLRHTGKATCELLRQRLAEAQSSAIEPATDSDNALAE